MKVLHIISSEAWNDTARFVLDLCTCLSAGGVFSKVFTNGKPEISAPFQKNNLLAGKLGFGSFARNFSSPIQLAKAIEKAGDDVVVHTHNFDDAYLALKARKLYKGDKHVKLVCSVYEEKAAPDQSLHAMIVGDTDALLFPDQNVKKAYLAGKISDCPKMQIAPLGLNADCRCNHTDSPVKLIFVGAITQETHLLQLIAALGEMKDLDWTLDVCGEGRGNVVMPAVRTARDRDINDRIRWHGDADPAKFIGSAHIGLLPTPLQTLEFMAAGMAILTTDHRVIEHEQNGLVCTPDKLEAPLRRLITDEQLRKTLGENAKQSFCQNYEINIAAKRILDIYHAN